MADKTRSPDTTAPDAPLVRYDLGRPNWDPGWIPDLTDPQRTVPVGRDQIIDVLILGDGFPDRADFESQLDDWLDDFFDVDVYERFRGAFRVRALFRRSDAPVTAARRSYYRVPANADDDLSSSGSWWGSEGDANDEFRTRLFDDMGLFDFNDVLYPGDLDVSDGGTVIHNELAAMFANCVVCMLTFNSAGSNGSGFTRRVPFRLASGCLGGMLGLSATPLPPWVNVAFGANSLHEFGHAFAYLEDEYIDDRGSSATRSNPATRSIFTLSNLTFSPRLDEALWGHISPWGRVARQGAGDDPTPTVGWLWRGGEEDLDVWHAEYHCLMNGRHDNYLFTSDAAEDPTAQPDGTYQDETGARLRSDHRYCLWCQELVTARILEKTGQLAAPGDPASINSRGQVWYDRWVDTWRDRYWDFFELDIGVLDRERLYAAQGSEFDDLNNNGLELWRSDLYESLHGDALSVGPPGAVEDGEALLLMTA